MRWFDSDPVPGDAHEQAPGGPEQSVAIPAGTAIRPEAPDAALRGTAWARSGEPIHTRSALDPRLLGPLAHLMRPEVTDLLVNAGAVWTDSPRGLRREGLDRPLEEQDLRELAAGLVAAGGRHLDHASPCVDAPLPGGARVHAVIPPVSGQGTCLSIRLPRPHPLGMAELTEQGALSMRDADLLEALVHSRANILITGAAGAGKTTLLAALLASAPTAERIVTIEDVRELVIDHPHVVALETRQANTDGVGGITLAQLVREALRMRPDRLILGEVRGTEVRDMLLALGSGHDGGGATMHARSLDEVGIRLEMLGGLAGIDGPTLARMVECALDAVVHVERVDGHRRVAGIGRPFRDGDRIGIRPFAHAPGP